MGQWIHVLHPGCCYDTYILQKKFVDGKLHFQFWQFPDLFYLYIYSSADSASPLSICHHYHHNYDNNNNDNIDVIWMQDIILCIIIIIIPP